MAKRKKSAIKQKQKQKQHQSVHVTVNTGTRRRASNKTNNPRPSQPQQLPAVQQIYPLMYREVFNQPPVASMTTIADKKAELAPVKNTTTIDTQTEEPQMFYNRHQNQTLLDRLSMKTPDHEWNRKSHGAYAENYDGFPNPSNLFNSGSNPPVNEAMLQINTPVADVVEPDFDKIIGQSKATIIKNFNKQQLVRYGIKRIGLVPNSSGQYPKIDLLIKMLKAGKQT